MYKNLQCCENYTGSKDDDEPSNNKDKDEDDEATVGKKCKCSPHSAGNDRYSLA